MYTMLRHTMESFVELWSNTNEDKSQILYIRETGCIKPSTIVFLNIAIE